MKFCKECNRYMPEFHFQVNHNNNIRTPVRKWGDGHYWVEDHTPIERLHSDDLIEYLVQKQHRIILALENEITRRRNELAALKRTHSTLLADINNIIDQPHKSGHIFSWEKK